MKFCFPPHVLFPSPPLSKSVQGKIFFRVGKHAEDRIADDYQRFTGRNAFYPKPIDADDFRDGNQQLNSKTIYFSFIVEKNPEVNKTKLEELMNQRVIQGKDGQIVYIPDFMSEKAPAAKRFYEVKPGLPHHNNTEGETKIASVRSLMQDVDLPYVPGTLFNPNGRHILFSQIVFIPGAMLLQLQVIVTIEYKKHNIVDGLVVYNFCIDANFKKALALSLIIAIAAVIILAVLFPDLLEGIPLPPFPLPIPRIPELPLPRPSPVPVPPQPQPQPVPAIIQQFRSLLSSFPARATGPDLRRRALRGSVGNGGRNLSGDVQAVQFLLNAWQGLSASEFLDLDGIAGPLTCGAIASLQQAAGLRIIDGRVDPEGPTLEVLGKLCAIGIAMAIRATASPSYIIRDRYPLVSEDILSVFWSGLASGRS